jgi:hypothetical protein
MEKAHQQSHTSTLQDNPDKDNDNEERQLDSYEHTMWNRVFREMTAISALVSKMQRQQEEDAKSWLRYVWPRSQEKHQ